MESYKEMMDAENINMNDLIDIKDIRMEDNLTRAERISYLKKISNNGYVKYDNVLIKLDFVSVFPKDYLENVDE